MNIEKEIFDLLKNSKFRDGIDIIKNSHISITFVTEQFLVYVDNCKFYSSKYIQITGQISYTYSNFPIDFKACSREKALELIKNKTVEFHRKNRINTIFNDE